MSAAKFHRLRFSRTSVGQFRGFVIYGDPERNPLLAVQHGPGGWLVVIGKRRLLAPKVPS